MCNRLPLKYIRLHTYGTYVPCSVCLAVIATLLLWAPACPPLSLLCPSHFPSSPPTSAQDQSGTQLISGGVTNGRLSCTVRRAINTTDSSQDYPLDQEGFVLFAYGDMQGGWNEVGISPQGLWVGVGISPLVWGGPHGAYEWGLGFPHWCGEVHMGHMRVA